MQLFLISIEQAYTKFINKNNWEEALASDYDQAEKLEAFFLRYHRGPQELKMAIDNVTLKYFPTLLQCCLESLVFLSKPNKKKYSGYIDQILGSTHFYNLFSKELQIMNAKLGWGDDDVTRYQKFINYFLKVVHNSLELQLQQLPKYVNLLRETVSNLEKRNSKFTQVLRDIKDLYDKLTNPQPSSIYQPKPQNVVNQGTNQQQTQEPQYRPRNFQVEFLKDNRQNNVNLPQSQSYQNNLPQIQQQQFVQIQPTSNNTQSNIYQPRLNQANNIQTYQQNNIQNSKIDNNNLQGFQTLQFDSQSQIPQNHRPPLQTNTQQQYQHNQQTPQQSQIQQNSFVPYQSFQNQQIQQNQYPPPQQQIQQNQTTSQQLDSYYQKQQNQPEYYQPKQQKQQEEQWVEKPQVQQFRRSDIPRQQDNQNKYQQQYREDNGSQYEVKKNSGPQYEVKQYDVPQYEVKKSNAPEYEAKQYNTQYEAKQNNDPQYEAKQYNAQQYNTQQYDEKQYNSSQCEVKQSNASLYEAKQYNEQKYEGKQYNTRQYNDKQDNAPEYEVKKPTKFSRNYENSQQEYRSSNQGYQNKPINIENYKPNIEYYNQMKNFYQQNQSSYEQNRQKQTEQAYVSYKDCSIEPMVKEFETVPNKDFVYGGCIFEIPIGQPFKSRELFLNNHFFILREDYLKSFRNVVARLKQNHFEELSYEVLQNAFLYYNVLIENITVTNRGLQFAVTMNAYDARNNSINWVKTTRLMPGSLLLLSTIKLEFMLFGTVVEKPKADRNGRVAILLILIGLSIKEQLKFVNSLLSQEQNLVAIENKTYFETYTHFLSCLQMIEPSRFPFAEQIVFGSKVMPRPGYLDNQQVRNEGIVYDIDLKFDLHQQKRIGQKERINIMREWPNVNTESLDESQLQAIKSILKNGISLIQGPPGTGKTFCGALGVRILLENQYKWNQNYQYQNKPILIVCQTNHALDQFLSHMLTFCRMEDIVRIGGRCKVKEFEPMLLTSNQQLRKIHFNWPDFLDLREDLDIKLRNLLNLTDNVNYKDVEQYMPELLERVIFQYLEIEDLNFHNPLSSVSRKQIMHMWLDNFKPQIEQANKIIDIEEANSNYLLQRQVNRKKFKPILVYKFSDLDHQFRLTDEAQQQLDDDLDEEFLDENQNIDSDEEENRKIFTTSEKSGKEEFVRKLIEDSRTMKRLLNRLGQENEVSFNVILNEINQKQNYQIWEMPQAKRNVITRYIFSQKFQHLFQLLQREVDQYEIYVKQLKQAYIDRDMKYIQTKRIVGATLSGCAKYAEKLSNLKFNILVVEEAGEVLESNLIAVLSQQINHLILIGDHQQLKPHLECYDLEVKFRANISLFERLIKNGLEYATLRYQRRMKSKFADFIRLIYKDYKDHSSIEEQNKIHLEGFNSDLLFFDHRKSEDKKLYSSSKQNQFEARMIVKMVDYLLKNGHTNQQITILTTYVRQALYIQKECGNRNIKVQAIDNYQGEENDIILLSLVRSNDEYKLGFVAIDNRVCVALSRARLGLYVFGDFDFIKVTPDVTGLWLKIIDLAEQKGVIKNHIELKCSSHNQITKIYDVKDWDQVKGGGCQNTCGAEFPCGHICQLRCHKSNHLQNDCPENCEKILTCGHQCYGRCKQYPCPPCRTMVQKQIQECGHTTSIQCSDQHKKTKCRERCEKILNCGHQCALQCIDDCKMNKCLIQIQYTLPLCKHVMSIGCDDQNYLNKLICQQPCQSQSICGHQCCGSCGVCFEKFHYPCQNVCEKILLCGHKCKQLCSVECYKCEDKCEIECNCNTQCKKKCNEKCNPCQNNCKLSCQHTNCTKKCYEICDRKPCNQKCDKKLKCGCDCMGFCGEVCPEICQIQDHKNQFADKDTIYYQLECKCNFISEAEFLDQYFDSQQSNFIHCPKCNQIIWRSRRYQSQVKNSLIQFNIEKEKALLKQQITNDKIKSAIKLTEEKLELIQKNKIKDNDSFLDKILQGLKYEMQQYNAWKPQKMSYHYFKCVKRQLKYYETTLELIGCLNDNQLFNIHKNNLIHQYLLNEDFRSSYSKSFWWKVAYKMENLLLYQKIIAQYQKTKDIEFQNISYAIEDSNFYLDDGKKQSFEKILNESIAGQQ
ncbi:unnamed protein product (macronuclear) [Paramecium tetraurelia]|uniref:P-loop containing nucleoside triphosphate hydrolase n=1 Tax=Paramecium tetraurelia TaxID=5888 RepID=A0DRN2_PARTE|nr:uncharacterized protein GSPATT00019417001 [Paramecium tetraurelia]CAK85699.1 unnamed protein product [Paramecium tetraurelia]|eukprot:XP_001453096.1 hypothetical protein (macronuclear) [Paramecium tetraurelia strain d4-2]